MCRSLFTTVYKRASAKPLILLLHTASIGNSPIRYFDSTRFLDRRLFGPYFLFCTLPPVFLILRNASLGISRSPRLHLYALVNDHLLYAAVSIIYHLVQLPPSTTSCNHHHLLSAAATINYRLLQLPPPTVTNTCCNYHLLPSAPCHLLTLPSPTVNEFITTYNLLPLSSPTTKSTFVCSFPFLSLVRLGYTEITGYSCLPNIS